MKVKSLSRVRLFATPWTAAHLAPPSMGFSRQEYWSGVPLPSPSVTAAGGKHTRPDSPGPKKGGGSQGREQRDQPSHLTRAQGACICLLAKLTALSLHFARKLPSCFFQFPLWVRKAIKNFLITRKEKKESEVASRVPLFAAPWTVTYQAPLTMGFSRQEYWSGLPFPSPGESS